jgi:hypothetical protein
MREPKNRKAAFMLPLTRLLLWTVALACGAIFTGQILLKSAEQDRIRQAMAGAFSRPNDPVTVAPLVMDGEHAVVGWVQGGQGGRSILRKVQGKWNIVVCGGRSLKDAANMAQTGIPLSTAISMAESLASAETKLDADTLKKFASFDGVTPTAAPPGTNHLVSPEVAR